MRPIHIVAAAVVAKRHEDHSRANAMFEKVMNAAIAAVDFAISVANKIDSAAHSADEAIHSGIAQLVAMKEKLTMARDGVQGEPDMSTCPEWCKLPADKQAVVDEGCKGIIDAAKAA